MKEDENHRNNSVFISQSSAGAGSALQVHAIRVRPGQELLGTLQAFVEVKRLRAPFIVTCVGSLTKATLRLANATATKTNEVVEAACWVVFIEL